MRTAYNQAQIDTTKSITKIIGDSSNILILYELMNFGEKSFNELKRMTDINPVTLSKKLSNLKLAGLVDSRQVGIQNNYYLTNRASMLSPLIKDIEKLIINNKL